MSKEKEIADGEEKKVAKINEEVSKKQRDCERDLAKAEPALKAASEALNTLNKVSLSIHTYIHDQSIVVSLNSHNTQANLTELKSFGKPPPAVVNVAAAVMVLLAPPSKIPKDRSWNAGKVMMGKVSSDIVSTKTEVQHHCCSCFRLTSSLILLSTLIRRTLLIPLLKPSNLIWLTKNLILISFVASQRPLLVCTYVLSFV